MIAYSSVLRLDRQPVGNSFAHPPPSRQVATYKQRICQGETARCSMQWSYFASAFVLDHSLECLTLCQVDTLLRSSVDAGILSDEK